MAGTGGDGAPAAVRPALTSGPVGEDVVAQIVPGPSPLHRGRSSMTTGTNARMEAERKVVKGTWAKLHVAFVPSRFVESDRYIGPEPTRPFSM